MLKIPGKFQSTLCSSARNSTIDYRHRRSAGMQHDGVENAEMNGSPSHPEKINGIVPLGEF
jgi:hypothetical protein